MTSATTNAATLEGLTRDDGVRINGTSDVATATAALGRSYCDHPPRAKVDPGLGSPARRGERGRCGNSGDAALGGVLKQSVADAWGRHAILRLGIREVAPGVTSAGCRH